MTAYEALATAGTFLSALSAAVGLAAAVALVVRGGCRPLREGRTPPAAGPCGPCAELALPCYHEED